MNSKQKSARVALLALFTAVTIILQLMSYSVKIGTFNLSLVLIPIVLGGALYGIGFGSFLGAAFGIITVIGCVTGLDAGGNILFNASPLLTVVVCMLKGTLCGTASAAVAKAFNSKPVLSTYLATATAPVVNTGLFIALALLFFKDILYSWAGGTNMVTYIIVGLVGVNFLLEFAINLLLTPALLRVIKVLKR